MKKDRLEGTTNHFLVTGGAGFIGSNLTLTLLERGARVTVLDNLATGSQENIVEIEGLVRDSGLLAESFSFIEGDIRDPSDCARAVEGVDYVLHNAALGSVPRSIEDPVTSTEVNVTGTLNMLVASKDAEVSRFVYASSSSVYGDSDELPKVEGSEGRPLSPYAAGKCACELYAQTFQSAYGLEVVGLRYFNVFGPRQDPHSPYAAVIPIFVKSLLKGKAPTINGDGETSRDFTYVSNAVEANIDAALAPASATGRAYNIACGGRLTLNELYKAIAGTIGAGATDIKPVYGLERAGDVRHSFAGIDAAREGLGYAPEVDLKGGLELSIDWYRKNLG